MDIRFLHTRAIKIAILALLGFIILPHSAQAFTFHKNFIISDSEMRDENSLSLLGISNFLKEKGSALASYVTTNVAGEVADAAQIIYETAQTYDLNPKVLLVMSQKESSAITSPELSSAITDWTLGYAVCDGCSKEDPQVLAYKGLAKQFDAAGSRITNSYLADLEEHGYTISGWGPGISKTTIDGIEVTPSNNATAALYTYNPCVGAYGGGDARYGCNSLFAKLWSEWFPSLRYPNGSLLQDGATGAIYLIRDGQKILFENQSALVSSYSADKVIPVSSVVLEQYERGGTIRLPNYAIVRSPAGTIYLLVDGVLRGFTSQKAFAQFGYNPEEVIDVSWKDLKGYTEGDPLTAKDLNPQGVLLQNNTTGGIVYIDSDGVRHEIWDKQILFARFGTDIPRSASPAEINKYTAGKPLTFPDGELVTSPQNHSVYVIANGRKRAFTSKDDFDVLGYKWDQIRLTSDAALRLHPTGSPIKTP